MTDAGGNDVTAQAEALAEEIKVLHKGRGVGAGDLSRRVGPLLRELADIGNGGSPADLRGALAAALSRCAARLDDDQRTTVLAALGLAPETAHLPQFGDRVTWLAERIDRDYRTARRRVDEAEGRLAEEGAKELGYQRSRPRAVRAWYVAEFRAVYRLDGAVPEAHEYRRIVAVQRLTEVQIWLDVPRDGDRPRPSLTAEVVFGGRLIRREEPSRTRTQFVIELPAPLLPGQSHEFEVILRAPAGAQMRPYYIFTPELPCDSFSLRVRFDPQRLPVWVRRVDGEPVRTFEDARPAADEVAVDPTGEARASFAKPVPYLGYGLQWQF